MSRTNIKDLAQQRFIAVPKLLLYGEDYKELSGNAFKVYVALYDRFTLSIQNNWIDDDNNVYFVYDLKDLEEITSMKESALRTARKQLKEVGLLEEISTGRNYRLYLSLPAPKNEEEAKYIIDDNKTFEDTSSWSDEERKAKSDAMKKNSNADKTSDTGKSSVASETLSSQGYSNLEKQAILENQVSDTGKSSTNDTNLMKLNKDIKDIKDQNNDEQNRIITQSFDNKNQKNEMQLIEQHIQNNAMYAGYGEQTVNLMKTYSFGNYDTFKIYSDKFHFGLESAEKESGKIINPYHKEALHDQLAKTFKNVIMKHKAGKTNNVNNYLFVAIKNVFLDLARFEESIENKPENTIDIPLYNWLD